MFIILLAFTEKVFSNHGRRLSGALNVSGSWVIKMAAEYAVYKGDKFIDLGTADYLANKFGVPRKKSGIGRRRLIGGKTKVIR